MVEVCVVVYVMLSANGPSLTPTVAVVNPASAHRPFEKPVAR